MELNRLDLVSWQDSQLLYHAQPRLDREGLNLLAPATPYVCVGYFQATEQEVDLAYCRDNQIPVFRREVGGGAVYLDGDQLFFQLVIHRDNPLVPAGGKLAFYRKFLGAPIAAYRAMGIPAEYREVNDIVANGRKVSGCGVAEIRDYLVLVGNLIADFDYETMARVLKVPNEKFRDRVYKTMHENLSTIRRELGFVPPREELWSLLSDKFVQILGPLPVETEVDELWRAKADELANRFIRDEWLHQKRRRQASRDVRIRAGVNVLERTHKAPGGLLRAVLEVRGGVLATVVISGDFFFYPRARLQQLETALANVPLAEVGVTVARFYEQHEIESPGVTPHDFRQLLAP